jgi:hypothetical protein
MIKLRFLDSVCAHLAALIDARLFNAERHLKRQAAFSRKTFGPGLRTAAVIDHIRKELDEVAADPLNLSEWADLIILSCDGALRAALAQGLGASDVIKAWVAKQRKNEKRVWPDWRKADPNKAIEHDRTHDCSVSQ